ncbi:ribose transport system permease protein [Motilibacter rhizosphaerae]|uniref:Ribose transport system permease protein n=1 Tax=Motilibacter rhizosphaerae TaxID=598652 RepID=A0A4Q7NQD2_9ACTN|nr:ABC transporter permease [Motilibacter rhizosphaerae]RZS87423.1 ribose transport system permease protein [Motilibacter rhizosphaerae]
MSPTPDLTTASKPVLPEPTAPVHVATDERGVTAGRERARALTSLFFRSGAIAVLVLTCLLAAVFDNGFASLDNLRNIALASSFIGIIAAGMTFVIISGGIDLSVGSLFALGVLVSAFQSQHGSVAAVGTALLCCGLAGLLQGLVIAYLRLPPFIVTLAGLTGIRGIVYYITDEGNKVPQVPHKEAFEHLGTGTFITIGLPVWIMLLVFAVGWWLLARTAFGQHVQTIGGSDTAAELMGLPVRRVKVLVYVTSGLCAGLAGILTTALSGGGNEARIGDSYELVAIAAVVIGGTLLSGGVGSMLGSLAGILLWYVINNIVVQGLQFNTYVQQVVSGAFLLVVVVLQTQLGKRAEVGVR